MYFLLSFTNSSPLTHTNLAVSETLTIAYKETYEKNWKGEQVWCCQDHKTFVVMLDTDSTEDKAIQRWNFQLDM